MPYYLTGIGQPKTAGGVVPVEEQVIVPTACPECAYLDQGSCRWCPDHAADIPGCEDCEKHKKPPQPWYARSEVLIPMVTAVTTAVVSSIAIAYALRAIRPA